MSSVQSLTNSLATGLTQLGIALSAPQQQQLLDYLAMLAKWNQSYNLTAVRSVTDMVPRHLLDSLSILPYVPGPRLLDVGSGAGLPGIPLAIARPEWDISCLDSNGKKTRFLRQVVSQLGLARVTVVHSRVEHYQAPQPFDCIVSRAYASIADMLDQAGHVCRQGGTILAMYGVDPAPELAALPPQYSLRQVQSLTVPGLQAARHVVLLACRGAAGAS